MLADEYSARIEAHDAGLSSLQFYQHDKPSKHVAAHDCWQEVNLGSCRVKRIARSSIFRSCPTLLFAS